MNTYILDGIINRYKELSEEEKKEFLKEIGVIKRIKFCPSCLWKVDSDDIYFNNFDQCPECKTILEIKDE